MPGDRVRISRDGDRLILEPIGKKDILDVLATLEPIEEDFPDVDAALPPLDDDPLRQTCAFSSTRTSFSI